MKKFLLKNDKNANQGLQRALYFSKSDGVFYLDLYENVAFLFEI